MPTVLVAVDSNEARAAAQAAAVRDLPAAAEDCRAVVTHVFDDSRADVIGEMRPFGSHEGLASVRRAVTDLRAAGIETVVVDRSGRPARDILALAAEHDADWIVLGNGGRSRLSRRSVSERVRKRTDRPVVVA